MVVWPGRWVAVAQSVPSLSAPVLLDVPLEVPLEVARDLPELRAGVSFGVSFKVSSGVCWVGAHIFSPSHCWPHQHRPVASIRQVPEPQQRVSSFMGAPV